MSTLISVFAVRFNAAEVFGENTATPEVIMGLTATVVQGLSNRGMVSCAVGMEDDGTVTLVFERANEAGRAIKTLSMLIEVLKGERGAWNEQYGPGDPSLN